ncbi:MAG: rhomboid family intramembrane serine protease [Calditrichaeota bacterium]|nr:MAG: rhomboid family intramembrane serine protease [Calditrichota bacterium]MBL1204924.1 rhomboid family intramembrane serine protease [Calditrichota bacterium]NOG44753.1 rhomboid family intramembrane serine protease [Calditrichota bacterium]
MIPIADESPRRYLPIVNYFLIGLNIVVFVLQPSELPELKRFFYSFGTIPSLLLNAQDPSVYLTVFSSMFVHGGFFHLAGNILYLWIFGDNIEYILGHFRYLVFYLIVGIGAAMMQVFFLPDSTIPMVGASGAISGILGAYLVKFPRNKVSILLFLVIIIRVIKVPAIIALGLWFLFQLYNGYFSAIQPLGGGGVAWFAHIGGFLSGFILIKLFEWYPKYN